MKNSPVAEKGNDPNFDPNRLKTVDKQDKYCIKWYYFGTKNAEKS